ncbi:DUF4124 domain-containing protein [Chitinilyticum aquatile]|uniref:DUF4124 domain-containing protein n=1 Tax=Chitinilyticum aquatile TaxID=362520 RepID=UPI00040E41C5|nr:DUF4124 domain-containing protein [Chitinilyticum aquatile]
MLNRASILLSATALLSSAVALADIYKYVDENGNVTYTNSPVKGAQRVYIEQPNVISSGSGSSGGKRSTGTGTSRSSNDSGQKVSAPSPANFPKVDSATQRSRDSNRKRILQDELANEQTMLNDSKKALSEAETTKTAEEKANPSKYLERIGRLRENVVMHEKNIAALQKELSRVQ